MSGNVKRQSPGIEFRDKVRDDLLHFLLQGGRSRKKRSGVTIIAQAEQESDRAGRSVRRAVSREDRAGPDILARPICGSISPRMRMTDCSGTAAGKKSDSRAMR